MADKKRERWYLERLRGSISDFPSGAVVPGESPDFLVQSEEGITGIEITQFFLPPLEGERPQQELQSLKDRMVNLAHRAHMEAGGPALYVTVHYRTTLSLTKRDIQEGARELAEAVLKTPVPKSIEDPPVSVAWGDMPEYIASVRIHGSIDGEDQLWSADSGGWVASINAAHIDDVIARKTRMARIARTKCDQLWLVIVNDAFSRAAPAELEANAAQAIQIRAFERIIWLDPHAQRTYEIPQQAGG